MEKTSIESERIEQLMRPRYKVIADYPKSPYPVGTVVRASGQSEDLLYCDWQGPRMRDYPHLFRKLEWWQERSIEEMPEYVKWVLWNEPQIEKVNSWRLHGKIPYADVPSQVNSIRAEYFEPATEQEYLTHSQAGER